MKIFWLTLLELWVRKLCVSSVQCAVRYNFVFFWSIFSIFFKILRSYLPLRGWPVCMYSYVQTVVLVHSVCTCGTQLSHFFSLQSHACSSIFIFFLSSHYLANPASIPCLKLASVQSQYCAYEVPREYHTWSHEPDSRYKYKHFAQKTFNINNLLFQLSDISWFQMM